MDTSTTLSHVQQTLNCLDDYEECPNPLIIDGSNLTISKILYVADNIFAKVSIAEHTDKLLHDNAEYLQEMVDIGKVIYGVSTGYGGSADTRFNDATVIQKSLIRMLNSGFGDTLPNELIRAVMLVRANSLCKGYSGVRPVVVHTLLALLAHNIVPVVPKRGSISASGDLVPTSYIAACMSGRADAKVIFRGEEMFAPEALKQADILPIVFITKEALAVVNASSFASSLAAMVLYDANIAMLLTQVTTALSVECLNGRLESFHPTIHSCMPHSGQLEVARNIRGLLADSKFAIHSLEIDMEDRPGVIKQDRYALRTSPQWLSPALETLQKSVERITTEINSASDNPLIDHRTRVILHCGNFQGISITVAMDQTRQAIQICGKLLFAQSTELMNWTYSNGLPPNLSGSDVNVDFGFKGVDIAMASYCSELDYLTNPLSNHVLSAEMHNQDVNSMALVSARMTSKALDILRMMISCILCAQAQAADLRWLKGCIEHDIGALTIKEQYKKEIWPWYNFAFRPRETFGRLYDEHLCNGLHREDFVEKMALKMAKHIQILSGGATDDTVVPMLGKGTRKMYVFIRRTLAIPFCNGERALDTSLQRIYDAIRNRDIAHILRNIFDSL